MPEENVTVAPDQGQTAPEGQQSNQGQGNDSQVGNQGNHQATDFVEFEGVKVPREAFDKIAKERYKDQFDAFENKSRWQAENTRKSMENKAIERDAEAYRRLQTEQPKQPQNTFEAKKQAYVDKKSKAFPEVDPRFFESQFEDIWEMSGSRAQEITAPEREQRAKDWEDGFLKTHLLLKKDTPQYDEMVGLLQRGYDPEDAYEKIFKKEILESDFETRQKAADAERLKKLKGSPTGSQDGEKPLTGSRSDRIWKAMEKHGVQRE